MTLCNDKDYSSVYEYLENFSEYHRITESVCLVVTEKSCKEIKQEILSIIDKDDRIFITKIAKDIMFHNIIDKSLSRTWLNI